ncbi:hypothetical protein [Lacticaseibacillus manihotivorans]|uniref:Uncharacterized protein n=2 Tax=Lacticaseibacillus manihotivorans TaxID=88233 RepID=A0A0R1QVR1_9LACO|nr:hypothetical protein [Lacticaseibacillus manihotivorans]KRL45272.1 hypothetical protein FD01_GL000748 [Lacticaseibacillus manihotivorans DSM 13343 = JCM 12514]QFQ91531.1 hypothetical protein LM010_08880 [Lacticaseibacillus manihotivorans]
MTELTPWLFLMASLLTVVQLGFTIIGVWLPRKIWLTASYFVCQTLLTFVQALFVGGTGILRDWNVMTAYDNWFFVTATFSGFLWLTGMLMLSRRTPQK